MMLFFVHGNSSKSLLAQSTVQSTDQMEQDKVLFNRLVTELKHSPRSFIYLRSKGYKQSDKEFEEIIAKNDSVFQRTRIVRKDENGVRQIPGWPGVDLTKEYKAASAPAKQ